MESPQDLAVQYHGEGFPILIIHGWTISGTAEAPDFEPIFADKSRYRRIYIDLPGMGATPAGNVQGLDDMFEAVKAFIAKNLHSSPFLLVGTSIGAYLARALAYEFKSSVEGLFLRVPVVDPDTSKRHIDPFQAVIADQELLSSYKDIAKEDIPVQTKAYLDIAQHKIVDIINPASQKADNKVLEFIRNDKDRYRLSKPLHTAEDPFTYPALILTGRQDSVVGFRDQWTLMDSYPRASFAAVDRGGHGFPMDQLDLFNVLVIDWLRRVEETQAHLKKAAK